MSETESINLYDNVSAIDYSMNSNTKGGAHKKTHNSSKKQIQQRQQSQQRQQIQQRQQTQQRQPIIVGGCLTCPKGKSKILAVLKILTVVIPREYSKYKKQFNKTTQTKQYKQNKPVVRKQKRTGRKTGGDWFGTDHCLECNKLTNADTYQKKFDANIMDTSYMNFYDAKPYSIYNLDTSLTDYTSRMGF